MELIASTQSALFVAVIDFSQLQPYDNHINRKNDRLRSWPFKMRGIQKGVQISGIKPQPVKNAGTLGLDLMVMSPKKKSTPWDGSLADPVGIHEVNLKGGLPKGNTWILHHNPEFIRNKIFHTNGPKSRHRAQAFWMFVLQLWVMGRSASDPLLKAPGVKRRKKWTGAQYSGPGRGRGGYRSLESGPKRFPARGRS